MLKSIGLRGVTPTAEVSPDNVFFAFGNGRLSYDCVRCNATCCRGHGYVTQSGRELEAQVLLRPSVRIFLESAGPGTNENVFVRNCPPACFFLRKDGLCRVHAEHGYEAKPDTCKHFPFNDMRRYGPYLIVAPHGLLCPLRIEPRGSESSLSSHQSLLETMATYGVSAPVPQCIVKHGDSDQVIALERTIARMSEELFGRGRFPAFVALQMTMEGDWTARGHLSANLQGSDSASTVKDFINTVCGLLGFQLEPDVEGERDLDDAFIALTPYLRSRLIFRTIPTARRRSRVNTEVARIPLVLMGGYLVAHAAKLAGMTDITFQTISRIALDFEPLLRLFTHFDEVVAWRPDLAIPFPILGSESSRRSYVALSKALLLSQQKRKQERFGELLIRHMPEQGYQGIVFLKQIAPQLNGRLLNVSSRREPSERAQGVFRVRPVLQHLVLQILSERFISACYQRFNNRSQEHSAA